MTRQQEGVWNLWGALQSPMLKTSGLQRDWHPFQSQQVPQPCHNPCQTGKTTPGHLTSKPWIPAELTKPVPRDATSAPWILGKQDHQGQRMHPHHACAPKDIPLCNARLLYLPSLAFLGLHLPIPKTSSPTDAHLPLPLHPEVP